MSKLKPTTSLKREQTDNIASEATRLANLEFQNQLFYFIGKHQIKHIDILGILRHMNSDRVFENVSQTTAPSATKISDKTRNFEYYFFELIGKYDFSHQEVISIMRNSCRTPSARVYYNAESPEKTRRYINPHTGAILVAREHTPHKLLRIWRDQYGSDVVDSWIHDEY